MKEALSRELALLKYKYRLKPPRDNNGRNLEAFKVGIRCRVSFDDPEITRDAVILSSFVVKEFDGELCYYYNVLLERPYFCYKKHFFIEGGFDNMLYPLYDWFYSAKLEGTSYEFECYKQLEYSKTILTKQQFKDINEFVKNYKPVEVYDVLAVRHSKVSLGHTKHIV